MSSIALILNDDIEIIREYSEGNKDQAATALVRKYQKFVFSTALRYLKNYEDADDASQEVFIRAFKNLDNFRGDASLKTWLYRIASNVCSSMLRKKKFFNFFGKAEEEDYRNIPSGEALPSQQLENEEFEAKFNSILGKLPDKQRETFALRYFENLTYEEISKLLGTSVGGLKANYFQAVKKIADLLEKENITAEAIYGKQN